MKKNCEIYGWDDNKAEEGHIADMALACMKKNQSPMEAEKSGSDKPASDSSDMTDIDSPKP